MIVRHCIYLVFRKLQRFANGRKCRERERERDFSRGKWMGGRAIRSMDTPARLEANERA